MTVSKLIAACLIALAAPTASAASDEHMPPLIEPAWLAERLEETDLVVLDIRNPYGGADRMTYEMGHIPGAVYSNYITDAWHDRRTPVPATLPPVAQLEALLGRLGIGNDSRVVLVHSGTDSSDFSSSARVYWIFRLLGHDAVGILDGGFRGWERAGLPFEQGWVEPQPAHFTARLREELLATTTEVEAALRRGVQLVDGRARELYEGVRKARLAARAGTLPTAKNLDHRRMIDPETGRMIGREALLALLEESGVRRTDETVTFCNVGHWSATTWFALHVLLGFQNVSLYDGSVIEWAASPERPMVILNGALRR
ncbi:MAG TPA: sulfurtransferase [Rhodocyclaceae bacterium]|nr:sulfurtransferase [Rhodocyclaceae bacterium]